MIQRFTLFLVIVILLGLIAPRSGRTEDMVENAGVVVGVTAGNMWFVPIKAISVVMGLTTGAASFVLSGGNAEMTKQIWQDSTAGPYLITPDVARTAIGERPELTDQ